MDEETVNRNGKVAKDGRTNHRRPGGQQGNQNARRSGAYAKNFVTDQERETFKNLRAELAGDFQKETGADSLELDMVCLMALRHGEALEKGDIDTLTKLDAAVRNHLAALKATRAAKNTSDKSGQRPITPAEWASNLLEKYGYNKKAQIDSGKRISIRDEE